MHKRKKHPALPFESAPGPSPGGCTLLDIVPVISAARVQLLLEQLRVACGCGIGKVGGCAVRWSPDPPGWHLALGSLSQDMELQRVKIVEGPSREIDWTCTFRHMNKR